MEDGALLGGRVHIRPGGGTVPILPKARCKRAREGGAAEVGIAHEDESLRGGIERLGEGADKRGEYARSIWRLGLLGMHDHKRVLPRTRRVGEAAGQHPRRRRPHQSLAILTPSHVARDALPAALSLLKTRGHRCVGKRRAVEGRRIAEGRRVDDGHPVCNGHSVCVCDLPPEDTQTACLEGAGIRLSLGRRRARVLLHANDDWRRLTRSSEGTVEEARRVNVETRRVEMAGQAYTLVRLGLAACDHAARQVPEPQVGIRHVRWRRLRDGLQLGHPRAPPLPQRRAVRAVRAHRKCEQVDPCLQEPIVVSKGRLVEEVPNRTPCSDMLAQPGQHSLAAGGGRAECPARIEGA